jgi:hypothetical protein
MAEWRTREHPEDHYPQRRHEFPGASIEQYDASAQETVAIGVELTYIDRATRERRTGYSHRHSSRFTVLDLDGYIHSHFRTDEAYVADLIASTYRDEGEMMTIDTSQTSEPTPAAPANASEMLDAVHRDLVQIHAAMAERTSDDREIKAWAQRELMQVIRDIGAFRRAHQKPTER